MGLAVNSGSTSALATATFDNVSVMVGAPVIASLSPASGEPSTTVTLQGNNFTVASTSCGYYACNNSPATADSLHYVYQPVSGDFDLRTHWQQVVGSGYVLAGLLRS